MYMNTYVSMCDSVYEHNQLRTVKPTSLIFGIIILNMDLGFLSPLGLCQPQVAIYLNKGFLQDCYFQLFKLVLEIFHLRSGLREALVTEYTSLIF